MGTWHLEVARMAMYLTFPVALFYWFNQPGTFDQYIFDVKKEYGIVDNPAVKVEIDNFIDKLNKEKMRAKYGTMDTKSPVNK